MDEVCQIVFTNVGNPHALGQKPLTFPRQVSLSSCFFDIFTEFGFRRCHGVMSVLNSQEAPDFGYLQYAMYGWTVSTGVASRNPDQLAFAFVFAGHGVVSGTIPHG